MSSLLNEFRRTTKAIPCPVCHKPDYCLVSRDTPISKVLCQRVKIGSRARWGNAGWLHVLRDDGVYVRPLKTIRRVSVVEQIHWDAIVRKYESDGYDGIKRIALAMDLGLNPDSLERMRVGWSKSDQAYTFPMYDASGICGIRLRHSDGKKSSVVGSKSGVFASGELHDMLPYPQLFIAEGPTDTAALWDLGFGAIGRPSCSGGTEIIEDLIRFQTPPEVVIVSDADEPGRVGARSLASKLCLLTSVRIIEPPAGHKDMRAWLEAGATHADVESLCQKSVPITPSVKAA